MRDDIIIYIADIIDKTLVLVMSKKRSRLRISV